MSKKLSIKEISLNFKNKGWKLVSNIYKNNKTPLEVICNKGHKTTITWNNFATGKGCKICANNQKLDFNTIKKEFKKKGWQIISNNYKNNKTPLKVICNNGHKTTISLVNFKNGHNCKFCTNNNIKHTYSYIKHKIISKRWKLISKEYKNSHSKLKVICNNGHKTTTTWNNFRNGVGCKFCKGMMIKTKDGHMVRSNYELDFDNFLYENNISHNVDFLILKNRKIRCDFKIEDTHIEI